MGPNLLKFWKKPSNQSFFEGEKSLEIGKGFPADHGPHITPSKNSSSTPPPPGFSVAQPIKIVIFSIEFQAEG